MSDIMKIGLILDGIFEDIAMLMKTIYDCFGGDKDGRNNQ